MARSPVTDPQPGDEPYLGVAGGRVIVVEASEVGVTWRRLKGDPAHQVTPLELWRRSASVPRGSLTPWDWRDRHVMTADGPSGSTVRLVLCGLARFVGKDGDCFPSVKTLCEATSLGERTVQAALKDAEVSGWLRRKAEPGHPTRYSPALPGDPSAVVRLGDTPADFAPRRICTPAVLAADPRSSRGGVPQILRPTPAESAPEGGKEGGREGRKEGPPCLLCSAVTYLQTSKRGDFWGCSRFKSHGCKGKGREAQDHVATAERLSREAAKTREAHRAGPERIGDAASRLVVPRRPAS